MASGKALRAEGWAGLLRVKSYSIICIYQVTELLAQAQNEYQQGRENKFYLSVSFSLQTWLKGRSV